MEKLPRPVIGIIASYLKIADRSHFARTCKRHLMFMPGEQDLEKLLKQKYKLMEFLIAEGDDCGAAICDICHQPSLETLRCLKCNETLMCSKCSDSPRTCSGSDDQLYCEFCTSHIKCARCSGGAYIYCFCCELPACRDHSSLHQHTVICSSCETFGPFSTAKNQFNFLKVYNNVIKSSVREEFFQSLNVHVCRICNNLVYDLFRCENCGKGTCKSCSNDWNCKFCENSIKCACALNAFTYCFYCNMPICQDHSNILMDGLYMCSNCKI